MESPQPLRSTYAPFAGDERIEIQRALDDPGSEPVCPRCGRGLTTDKPADGAELTDAVSRLCCEPCRRYVVFDDLGGRSAPRRRGTL